MKLFNTLTKLIIILIILIIGYFAFTENKQNQDTNSNLSINENAYFCPEEDCNAIVYSLFNNAEKIDCAIYDISMPWVYDVLKTKNSRIITDNEEIIDYAKQFDFIKTDNSKDYMHNKFCILDSNTLWIGSLNLTEDAIKYQNNNFIVTNNKDLINTSEKYFNELWNNNFNYGLKEKNICFSPNNCIDFYINEAKKASKIKCMLFSFTQKDFANTLLDSNANIQIIFEKSQNSQYSQYENLKNKNLNVIWDKNPKFMHNKFCIFDDKIITGSMNLSNNGNVNNNEGIIIIENKEIVKEYENYFDKYFLLWDNYD